MAARTHVYRGADVVVRYDAQRCIHAAECVRGLPAVFDPEREPWVDPSAASADEIVAIVQRCPTGALTCERRDGGAGEAVPGRNAVSVEADGPLFVRGDLALEDASGAASAEATRLALCRCGRSGNKPFCDGAHASAGFCDAARIAAVTSAAINATEAEGRVTIRPLANGPVILAGSFDVEGAEGTMAFRAGRAALCRCGASRNKPLCDGSHKAAGFRAP